MKTRYNLRAMSKGDEAYRVYYTSIPFFRALRKIIHYMRKYDEICVTKTRIY